MGLDRRTKPDKPSPLRIVKRCKSLDDTAGSRKSSSHSYGSDLAPFDGAEPLTIMKRRRAKRDGIRAALAPEATRSLESLKEPSMHIPSERRT